MEDHYYMEIRHAVPGDVELHVMKAARYGVRAHRIKGSVGVRYFVEGSAAEVIGWSAHTWTISEAEDVRLFGRVHGLINPNEIWVRADQPPREAARTALHEVTHVLELQSPNGKSAEWWENYCDRFATEHLARSLRS